MNTIKKIILSAAVILLLLACLSKLYDFALLHNANLKAAYVQREQTGAKILFHGPCEPLWMVSPQQIDSVTHYTSYNLALSHSDFADNYLHLYFYLKHNTPEYMFLYVTPESMDSKYNTFNTYRFAPFLGDPVVDSVVKECDPAYFRWTAVPFLKYAYYSSKVNFDALQGLKHYIGHRKTPYHMDGYEPPVQVVWDNHLEEFMQLYPHGYNFEWNTLREKYLCKTIALAQQKGVKVYLYESPVLKEALAYQPNREEILKKIRGIADNYHIRYVQFDQLKIAESRRYFMSTLNLNLEGSAIFNDTLAKYIKGQIHDNELISPHL